MRFDTYLPCPVLQPHIAAFAVSESAGGAYTVLPDTGLVLGFQYGGTLALQDAGVLRPLYRSGLTGLHDRYRVFQAAPGTGSVLVYFRPGGAAAFFREPVHLFFGESLSLEDLVPRSELGPFGEQLQAAPDDATRVAVVAAFLHSRLRSQKPDPLVAAALGLLHHSRGTLRVRELAARLHTSASPLEKRFRQAVGASPKTVASIVRLKHALQLAPQALSLTALSHDAGFYDQSHFIRAFKAFTGETPEAYVRQQHPERRETDLYKAAPAGRKSFAASLLV